MNSAKSNLIEEDSALKYNDYYQSANVNLAISSDNIVKNVLKENSHKENSGRENNSQRLYESKTSDIKEEIMQSGEEDDDGYIPYYHNEEDY
jgi:hypothetical protein